MDHNDARALAGSSGAPVPALHSIGVVDVDVARSQFALIAHAVCPRCRDCGASTRIADVSSVILLGYGRQSSAVPAGTPVFGSAVDGSRCPACVDARDRALLARALGVVSQVILWCAVLSACGADAAALIVALVVGAAIGGGRATWAQRGTGERSGVRLTLSAYSASVLCGAVPALSAHARFATAGSLGATNT